MTNPAKKIREVIDVITSELVANENFAGLYEYSIGVVPASAAYVAVEESANQVLDAIIEEMERKSKQVCQDHPYAAAHIQAGMITAYKDTARILKEARATGYSLSDLYKNNDSI